MENVDLALCWADPVDMKDLFLRTIEAECKARRLRTIYIDEKSLPKITQDIRKGTLRIKVCLDMASETYDTKNPFTKFVYLLKDSGTRVIDDPDDVKSAADKSITHFDLLRSKIPVPYTIVIRHWEPERRLSPEERASLGLPFVVKPALGYGQKGVKIIRQKRPLKEIAEARQFSPGDNFLLQEFIEPLKIEGHPAWFRVYQLFGEIIPCWWNPQTHEYRQVTLREMTEYKLIPLARIATEIGRITRIDWFSCEIAINAKNRKLVAIDYMNDQCAIYPKSEHKDGVPDDLVRHLAEKLVEKAWRHIRGEYTLTYRAIWFPRIQVKDENA
ncbi:MAG: hypothetical protein ABH871_02280 [Pseudomonadota bacterium]